MRDRVSGAIAIPKASWGCAPALPNRIRMVFLEMRFPITSRRQTKSFLIQQFFKNVGEVWASSPHLRSKFDFADCFSCCNCILWNCQIQTKSNHENQGRKFEQGNGAIAARWQAKAGVEPPFAGCCRPFSLGEIVLRKTNYVRFGRIASLSA